MDAASGMDASQQLDLDKTTQRAGDGFERSLSPVDGQTPGRLVTTQQGDTKVVILVKPLPVHIEMEWRCSSPLHHRLLRNCELHQSVTLRFDSVLGLT